jgi:hypothetical protein
LRREFDMALVVTQPTTVYELTFNDGRIEEIYAPARMPIDGTVKRVREMWSDVSIITPPEYLGGISQLLYDHEAKVGGGNGAAAVDDGMSTSAEGGAGGNGASLTIYGGSGGGGGAGVNGGSDGLGGNAGDVTIQIGPPGSGSTLGTSGNLFFNLSNGFPVLRITEDGSVNPLIGVFGASPTGRPTVSGSWGDGSAGASLAAALALLGWITDSTTP